MKRPRPDQENRAESERPEISDRVESLHLSIDEATAPLERHHADRLRCRHGCTDCCVDDLTVFQVEADLIRRHYPELLDSGRPHPPGACAMLGDDGACRVYAHRPYVCRTQGLPLRWLDQLEGETVEWRDICPLNEVPGRPVESLEADRCWTLGPIEQKLAALQAGASGTEATSEARVALRDLFRRSGG